MSLGQEIFSQIIRGEIPSYKLAENEHFYAFLDINPIAKGHSLVVPKTEVDYIFDLNEHYLSHYLPFAKKVAKAIESVVPCERIGLCVIGLEVPHAHIHLIPINGVHDIDFSRPKVVMSNEEMAELAAQISQAIDA
jgi:histidine triad (HIT) family protein